MKTIYFILLACLMLLGFCTPMTMSAVAWWASTAAVLMFALYCLRDVWNEKNEER